MASVLPVDYIGRRVVEICSTKFNDSLAPEKLKGWKLRVQKYFRGKTDKSISEENFLMVKHQAVAMVDAEIRASEACEHTVTLHPPKALNGNLSVYRLVYKLMTNFTKALPKTKINKELEKLSQSASSSTARMPKRMSPEPVISRTLVDDQEMRFAASLYAASSCIIGHSARAKNSFARSIAEFSKSGKAPSIVPAIQQGDIEVINGLEMTCIDSMFSLVYMGESFILSQTHVDRVSELLKSFGNLAISLGEMDLRYGVKEFILDFIKECLAIARDDSQFVGECIKAARNILVATLASDKILGRPNDSELMKFYDAEKRSNARGFIELFSIHSKNIHDALNLSNLYKYVPHPDSLMSDLFQSIEGLKEPNRIDMKFRTRFKGTARRALYRSLKASKHYVTLKETSPSGKVLADKVNATQVQIAKVASMSSALWDSVEFNEVKTIPKASEIKLAPSDKSSQTAPILTASDFNEFNNWSKKRGIHSKPAKMDKLRTVNDAAEAIKGDDALNSLSAIKRFEIMVNLHTQFEGTFPGMEPEDIPDEAFAKFIEENEEARYIVGTEPKAGEFHKKITRLFYIAEQDLKALTQRVERIGRQVSRAQTGVSIVKSYTARRKDLEMFCESMTGEYAEDRSVFVSFDMSEFSKKFPMTLVRAYGEILAEITGENWLRRIDLFFRASIVVHNTRGFFDYKSGIKGGFEGFLNFIWSSIHAVIMEVALESTGLSGVLLTFSDDGLLLFYFPRKLPASELLKKVLKIRETYEAQGLVFHLGKTLVSSIVWEYLGDICHNQKLLPMWVKDVSRMGIREETKGINTISDKLGSFIGQARSATNAGLSMQTSYIIMHYHCTSILERLAPEMPLTVFEWLMMIPTSCSGFRIPSPLELASSSTIPRSSEFIADLILQSRVDSELVNAVCGHIAANMVTKDRAILMIINDQRFATQTADTSGLSVVSKVIDYIIDHHGDSLGLTSSPITVKSQKDLTSILTKVKNLSPSIISKLVMKTPDYVAFTKSLQLVSSGGSVRLVSRQFRKKMQSKDTYSCRSAMKMWSKVILRSSDTSLSPLRLPAKVESTVFREYDLAPMKPSARLILTETNVNPSITVRFSYQGGVHITDEPYVEPKIKFPADSNTLKWFSQSSGIGPQKMMRNYMAVAAEALANDPDIAPVIAAVSTVFRCPLPMIPTGLVRSLKRRTAGTSSALDVRIAAPKHYWALSDAYYSGTLQQKIFRLRRADRGTYLEVARLLGILYEHEDNRKTELTTPGVKLIRFNLLESAEEYAFTSPQMEIIEGESIPMRFFSTSEDRSMNEEFFTSLREFETLRSMSAAIASSTYSSKVMDEEERGVYLAVLIEHLNRWITETLLTSKVSILPHGRIPTVLFQRQYVFRRAVIKAAWKSVDPGIRSKLTGSLLKTSELAVAHDSSLLSASIDSDAASTFFGKLINIVEALCSVDDEMIPTESLTILLDNKRETLELLAREVANNTLLPVFKPKLTVIRGASYAEGAMSPAHRVAYRQAFSNTITAIMSMSREGKWNEEVIRASTGIRGNIDMILDWLYITRDMIRESAHRPVSKPYNPTSAIIQAYKLYNLLKAPGRHFLEDDDRSRLKVYFSDWRMSDRDKHKFQLRMSRTNRIIGPDHLMMLDLGIPESIFSRFMHHINSMKRGQPLRNYHFLVGDHIELINDQTAFYNTIVETAARNIIDVSFPYANSLSSVLAPSTNDEASVCSVDTNLTYVGGKDIPPASWNTLAGLRELLSEHLVDLSRREGISYFSTDMATNIEGLRITMALDMNHDNGTPLGTSFSQEARGWNFVCKRFSYEDEALNTYINLARSCAASLTVFQEEDPGDNGVYVVGVVAGAYPRSEDAGRWGDPAYVKLTEGFTLGDIISIKSMHKGASDLASRNQMIMSGRTPIGGVVTAAAFINAYARRVRKKVYVNENSSILQAAAIACEITDDSATQLWSHVLLRAFLVTGGTTPVTKRLLRDMYYDIMDRLTSTDSTISALAEHDISSTTFYLRTMNIVAGNGIDMDLVRKIIEMRPSGRVPFSIQMTCTTAPSIGIEDLVLPYKIENDDIIYPYIYARVVAYSDEDSDEVGDDESIAGRTSDMSSNIDEDFM